MVQAQIQAWISLVGLSFDVVGFLMIARELFKLPDKRLMWGAGASVDRTGIILVVVGFALQAVAQALPLL